MYENDEPKRLVLRIVSFDIWKHSREEVFCVTHTIGQGIEKSLWRDLLLPTVRLIL